MLGRKTGTCYCAQSLSRVQPLVTLWTVALQGLYVYTCVCVCVCVCVYGSSLRKWYLSWNWKVDKGRKMRDRKRTSLQRKLLLGGPKKSKRKTAQEKKEGQLSVVELGECGEWCIFSQLWIPCLPLDASFSTEFETWLYDILWTMSILMYKLKLWMQCHGLTGLFPPFFCTWIEQHTRDRNWLLWPSFLNMKTMMRITFLPQPGAEI